MVVIQNFGSLGAIFALSRQGAITPPQESCPPGHVQQGGGAAHNLRPGLGRGQEYMATLGMRYFFLVFPHDGRPEVLGSRIALGRRRLELNRRLMVNQRRLPCHRQLIWASRRMDEVQGFRRLAAFFFFWH